MARLFSIKPSITFKGRKFKGLRGWAGKPLHPPLTDVVVGAYVLAMVFDVISYAASVKGGEPGNIARDFFVAGTYAIIAGAIVSLPTTLTGFWDWYKSTEPGTQAWRTANWHMAVMVTVTVIVVANIVVRLGQWDDGHVSVAVLILSLLAGGLVSYGATYGGSLVFDYEFNVEQDNGHAWAKSEVDVLPGSNDS
jgi:uncharacterized membrane protein